MTNQEIETFLAIVEQGSISRAAETLFLTQSTLSNRLALLETELGATLFRRGRGQRNLALTDAGERFLPLAEQWRLLWKETSSFQAEKKLSIVSISSVNAYIMPQILKEAEDFPHISLCTFHTIEAYQQIETGQAELAFVSSVRHSRYVEAIPLFVEQYQLIHTMERPFAQPVVPSQLPPERELLVTWHPSFTQWHQFWFGPTSFPALFTDDMQILNQFLGYRNVWAVLPQSVARHTMESLPVKTQELQELPEGRMIYLLKRWGRELSGEARAFLSALAEWCKKYGLEYLGPT